MFGRKAKAEPAYEPPPVYFTKTEVSKLVRIAAEIDPDTLRDDLDTKIAVLKARSAVHEVVGPNGEPGTFVSWAIG